MSIEEKLSLESMVSNILMYGVMLIGSLFSVAIDMIATLMNPAAAWYTLPVVGATMYAGALCHYFVHRGPAYLAKKGDSEMQEYETYLKKNKYNKLIVGVLNIGFLLVLVGISYHSLSIIRTRQEGDMLYTLPLSLFVIFGITLFAIAPNQAKEGWDNVKGI